MICLFPVLVHLLDMETLRTKCFEPLQNQSAWVGLSKTSLTHFILDIPKGVLAKSADPDQMPHNVASDLGLHYFASCSAIFQQKYPD